ncbi:MAG: hypothetical protein AAF292_08330 [Pseudomonadota bacterium]
MTDTSIKPNELRAFWLALGLNFIWINASEVWRYFQVVRPVLLEDFAGNPAIGAISPGIFASWMVWDTILIVAATGFYWMWLLQFRFSFGQAVLASLAFTVTIFGLIWIGIVNMGFVRPDYIWTALPLAWIEHLVAAGLTYWSIGRTRRIQ